MTTGASLTTTDMTNRRHLFEQVPIESRASRANDRRIACRRCCVSVGGRDVGCCPGFFNLRAARWRHQPIDHPEVLAGLIGVELPVQSVMLFHVGMQYAFDPAGDLFLAFLIGASPGDVVDEDPNPDR